MQKSCWYCHRPLSIFKSFKGDLFCSPDHEQLYLSEQFKRVQEPFQAPEKPPAEQPAESVPPEPSQAASTEQVTPEAVPLVIPVQSVNSVPAARTDNEPQPSPAAEADQAVPMAPLFASPVTAREGERSAALPEDAIDLPSAPIRPRSGVEAEARLSRASAYRIPVNARRSADGAFESSEPAWCAESIKQAPKITLVVAARELEVRLAHSCPLSLIAAPQIEQEVPACEPISTSLQPRIPILPFLKTADDIAWSQPSQGSPLPVSPSERTPVATDSPLRSPAELNIDLKTDLTLAFPDILGRSTTHPSQSSLALAGSRAFALDMGSFIKPSRETLGADAAFASQPKTSFVGYKVSALQVGPLPASSYREVGDVSADPGTAPAGFNPRWLRPQVQATFGGMPSAFLPETAATVAHNAYRDIVDGSLRECSSHEILDPQWLRPSAEVSVRDLDLAPTPKFNSPETLNVWREASALSLPERTAITNFRSEGSNDSAKAVLPGAASSTLVGKNPAANDYFELRGSCVPAAARTEAARLDAEWLSPAPKASVRAASQTPFAGIRTAMLLDSWWSAYDAAFSFRMNLVAGVRNSPILSLPTRISTPTNRMADPSSIAVQNVVAANNKEMGSCKISAGPEASHSSALRLPAGTAMLSRFMTLNTNQMAEPSSNAVPCAEETDSSKISVGSEVWHSSALRLPARNAPLSRFITLSTNQIAEPHSIALQNADPIVSDPAVTLPEIEARLVNPTSLGTGTHLQSAAARFSVQVRDGDVPALNVAMPVAKAPRLNNGTAPLAMTTLTPRRGAIIKRSTYLAADDCVLSTVPRPRPKRQLPASLLALPRPAVPNAVLHPGNGRMFDISISRTNVVADLETSAPVSLSEITKVPAAFVAMATPGLHGHSSIQCFPWAIRRHPGAESLVQARSKRPSPASFLALPRVLSPIGLDHLDCLAEPTPAATLP